MASDSSQSRWSRSARMDEVFLHVAQSLRGLRDMQPAFLVLRLLPPPAPGAHVLARQHRAAAGRAADRAVALLVETVEGNAVHAQVVPNRAFGPRGERVEFLQAVRGVGLALGELRAAGSVLAALAGDPGALAGERARERLDLADPAAKLAQLDAA